MKGCAYILSKQVNVLLKFSFGEEKRELSKELSTPFVNLRNKYES